MNSTFVLLYGGSCFECVDETIQMKSIAQYYPLPCFLQGGSNF